MAEETIPKILHQVWLGPKPLPDEFAAYRETWREHHPEWTLELWTEDNLPAELRRPEVRERLRVPAERADILRLEVLWRFGGVYVDTDFECRRPIDELIEGTDFFTAYLKPGRVNNAIIGATPGHPILDRALSELRPNQVYGYDKEAAGPLFLDRLVKEYPEIRIFDPPVFYPSTPGEREHAVAIHHVARSWKDAEGFEQAAARAQDRIDHARREIEQERARRPKHQVMLVEIRRRLERAEAGLRPDPPLRARALSAPHFATAKALHVLRRPVRRSLAWGRRLQKLGLRIRWHLKRRLANLPIVGRPRRRARETGSIPRIIHQIWLGPDQPPPAIERARRSWRRHHPGWEYRIWMDHDLPDDLRGSDPVEALRPPAERSQFLRLKVLHRFGGIYVDPDVECLRTLSGISESTSFIAASLDDGTADESILGATPGHPLLDRLLKGLKPIEYWGEPSDRSGRLISPDITTEYEGVELLPPEAVVVRGGANADQAIAVRPPRREQEVDELKRLTVLAEGELADIQRELDVERDRSRRLQEELAKANDALAAARAIYRQHGSRRARAS